ncbi:anti-sigma B factor RsbW [Salinicoccus roseus]|jgi:serine/threonine-protein kinase RsbW|uniref:Serine-protein kinase RsbW n=1 Tax=Salinicoccus roseus TaxID=45670 RepID=A0A0C2DKD9_9STAP|nr:anti-sigma B factor RsbW [Salinicoccus roseus]KIH70463.1 serine/threonine protein kinase [Salinicoccus roseus]MBY8910010.1 anti-sigma B factor RsbW [Salinicoccus roseus]MCG7333549.1 anti-sigma B factor RsbW [Salinicoccus roseus]MDB0580547.1 anti-sigma B factor RsbW [Salinicoccus roseus]OZT77709.1 anti-sigma B factor RsbW [Salinicoccus roseus]
MPQQYDYIEMKFPSSAEYVGLIRLTLSGVLSRAGASYDQIEDSKIAVSEAVTNAVKHAYGEDESGEVLIGFAIYSNKVEIIVADHGQSFNYEEVKEELGPYSEDENVNYLREGGLGLFLIETLMDEVYLKKDPGVTISMTKFINESQVHLNGETIVNR